MRKCYLLLIYSLILFLFIYYFYLIIDTQFPFLLMKSDLKEAQFQKTVKISLSIPIK